MPLISWIFPFKKVDLSIVTMANDGILPSGKLTVCYGKSPFLMGNQLFLWPFSIAMLVITRG